MRDAAVDVGTERTLIIVERLARLLGPHQGFKVGADGGINVYSSSLRVRRWYPPIPLFRHVPSRRPRRRTRVARWTRISVGLPCRLPGGLVRSLYTRHLSRLLSLPFLRARGGSSSVDLARLLRDPRCWVRRFLLRRWAT